MYCHHLYLRPGASFDSATVKPCGTSQINVPSNDFSIELRQKVKAPVVRRVRSQRERLRWRQVLVFASRTH